MLLQHQRALPRCAGARSAPAPALRATQQREQPRGSARPRRVARAQEDDQGPSSDLESLFSKELKRRGLDSLDDLPSSSEEAASTAKSPFATKTRGASAAGAGELDGQRQRSIAMVNEGLEGLIPRATELLKLGSGVFLAFGPFILAVTLAFAALYGVFGEQFVHSGSSSMRPPRYIDPAELLSEPTVDPYVPLR